MAIDIHMALGRFLVDCMEISKHIMSAKRFVRISQRSLLTKCQTSAGKQGVMNCVTLHQGRDSRSCILS